jgi:hypothetical protein
VKQVIQGISYKYCSSIHRKDGYAYAEFGFFGGIEPHSNANQIVWAALETVQAL